MKTTSPYIATGDELYFLIGNLYAGNNINYNFIFDLPDTLEIFPSALVSCYHYIDDFELIEIPDINASSSDSAIFAGESIHLNASELAEEQIWFANNTTEPIGSGISLQVSPTETTTFYLRSLQCKFYSWDTVQVRIREPLPPPFEPLQLFISNTISKDAFLINYTGDERPLLNMALFNSVGQLVYIQEFTESASIPISNYAPGIYYCRISKGSEPALTQKIVVMK